MIDSFVFNFVPEDLLEEMIKRSWNPCTEAGWLVVVYLVKMSVAKNASNALRLIQYKPISI
jgi:hypothetical protein